MTNPPPEPASTDALDRRQRGQLGEETAVQFLQQRGYTVVARNVRQGRVELDLICRQGDELVFVEVKARWNQAYGLPADAITASKRRNLILAATRYLEAHQVAHLPWRIDVLALTFRGSRLVHSELLKDAIEDEG